MRASQIESFLTQALAGGEQSVVALQERARAAGLLSERQSITDSKPFKSAKTRLGVQSKRVGFGPGATWFWGLAGTSIQAPTTKVAEWRHVCDVDSQNHITEIFPRAVESRAERPRDVPLEWVEGVDVLKIRPRLSGVPVHLWRVFVDDSRRFIVSPWARRAAELGWTANELFGSRYTSPHEHLGAAGLLWNLGGGQLVQLHRGGAAFITEDGRVRTFHRRPHRTMTSLPWR